MSDIHKCTNCGEMVYMDNAKECMVCGDWYCSGCDYSNGVEMYSSHNENNYFTCKSCLDRGVEYINKEHMDDANFTEEEYQQGLKEYKEWNKNNT